MKNLIINYLLPAFLLLVIRYAYGQQNWPQWRGPSQNGVCEAKDLPTTWSLTKNILWKVNSYDILTKNPKEEQ